MLQGKWSEFINGNNESLGELYEELFQPLVFRTISYSIDREVARDIVSQVFAELIAAPLEVRKERWAKVLDPRAFLLVIIRNKALDHLRSSSNRHLILERYTEEQTLWESGELEKELATKLEKCMSLLDQKERKLLQLHLSGYRNNDIADELKIAEKTVRNRLSLTRKMLAVRWQQLFTLFFLLCH